MVKTKTKAKKRKVPITVATASSLHPSALSSSAVSSASAKSPCITAGSSSKPESSRAVIRRFHVLLKRRAQLAREKRRLQLQKQYQKRNRKSSAESDSADTNQVKREMEEVEREMEEMGGLAAYQRMSSIGQGEDRGGGSEKVLIGWLKEMGTNGKGKDKGKGKTRLRLLEVGALKADNYDSCSSWIDVHPIDLRSRNPRIMEKDFLDIDLDAQWEDTEDGEERGKGVVNREGWDVVSLSLVVNFVPDDRDRGRMLVHAYNLLRLEGLLFLVLPLPCVSNSRYMTFEHLTQLMNAVGFEKIRERWKEGGKMAYWLFQKRRDLTGDGISRPMSSLERGGVGTDVHFDKKVEFRVGKRNNFCILL